MNSFKKNRENSWLDQSSALLVIIAKYGIPFSELALSYQALLRCYEQNNIVNNVHVDDWTAELVIFANNVNAMIRCTPELEKKIRLM